MKKYIVFIATFFLVFAPIYSNAVLPALVATVASNSGRVLVGQTIKKVAPSAISNARKAAVGICVKYPKLCGGGLGALGLALTGDGWNVEVTNNDTTNNIDVDIYKIPQGQTCYVQTAFGVNKESASVVQNAILKDRNERALAELSGLNFRNANGWESSYQNFYDDYNKPANKQLLTSEWQLFGNVAAKFDVRSIKHDGSGDYNDWSESSYWNVAVHAWARCVPWTSNDKIDITNNELNQYITNNNINDIDILDIYNFDFSQYNNINIGGDTYNGTTINNDLAKSDPTEADKKVSADLKKKLDSKELSLDDVNDENCTKNEAGEYDKCGATEEPPVEEQPTEEPTESPIECDANGFYKKVCDWMDWTQKEPKPSTSESVGVKDVDAENSNKIDMAGECPAPYELSFNVLGYEQNHSISYEPLCGALVLLKPIFVGSGALSGMFILMGYSRASNTGVNG